MTQVMTFGIIASNTEIYIFSHEYHHPFGGHNHHVDFSAAQ